MKQKQPHLAAEKYAIPGLSDISLFLGDFKGVKGKVENFLSRQDFGPERIVLIPTSKLSV